MIKPVEKLVQISSQRLESEKNFFRLETADGRCLLADRLMSDVDEWCEKAFDDGPRNHLGASIIGHECARHLWFTWRWIKHKVHVGRMQRLFQDGHWYEERFIEMLRGIGCKITQVSEDGKQQRIYAVDGHAGGSCDGTSELPERYGDLVKQYGPFLLECKTINTKGFSEFHDVKESKPEHFAQMCVYGLKLGIRYAIYFIVNKNDSDVKIEVVELDWNHAQRMLDKAQFIIYSPIAPPRLSDNPSDYRCKMCDHWSVCHQKAEPDVNCRSCRHSEAIENKQWRCRRWSAIIPSNEAMLAGCEGWERLQF
jgi:hypothetical protein